MAEPAESLLDWPSILSLLKKEAIDEKPEEGNQMKGKPERSRRSRWRRWMEEKDVDRDGEDEWKRRMQKIEIKSFNEEEDWWSRRFKGFFVFVINSKWMDLNSLLNKKEWSILWMEDFKIPFHVKKLTKHDDGIWSMEFGHSNSIQFRRIPTRPNALFDDSWVSKYPCNSIYLLHSNWSKSSAENVTICMSIKWAEIGNLT